MNFQPYPFERLNALLADITPRTNERKISLTIGEPQFSTPSFIQNALCENAALLNKYPKTAGEQILLDSMKNFIKRRFGVELKENELISTFGTRELLFNFPQFLLFDKFGIARDLCGADSIESNKTFKRPIIAHPNPFYQIYEGAAIASRAKTIYMNLTAQNGFKPYLSIEQKKEVDLVILNSPNNPTGVSLSLDELSRWCEDALKYNFVVLNDECYSEIYSQNAPSSILQAAQNIGNTSFKNILAANSISKRSSAPGLRSGFIAGDGEILKKYAQYRTYCGCASPLPLQLAAAAAWSDFESAETFRAKYSSNLTLAKEILGSNIAETFYCWLFVENDIEFTKKLYENENILVLPGSFLSRDICEKNLQNENCSNNFNKSDSIQNPGAGFVRLALVYEKEVIESALKRIKKWI